MELSKHVMESNHADLNALAAFIERRLPEADRQVVVAHLSECAECRATLATYARGATKPSRLAVPTWIPLAAALVLATTIGGVMWSNRTSAPGRDVPADQPAPRDINLPAPPAQPSPTPQGRTTGAPSGGAAQPDLAVRRGGERKVDGKTFRLVAGAWIDASFDPLAALPTRDVVGAEARASLLASDPVLAKYAALGPRVLVVHEKVVYRFQP